MPRHVLLKELDLRNGTVGAGYHDHAINTVAVLADRMNAVPGFKTSAAFFTFLRANLVLPPSTADSTSSTPLLDPSSSQTLLPLQPSSLATMTSVDDYTPLPPNIDSIPPLTTYLLDDEDDQIAALKLVADSIAQQRQISSRALIYHPITIAIWLTLLAVTAQLMYKGIADLALLFTTCAGVTMACLIAVRGMTSGYITLAEELSWKFIQNEENEEDLLIGSRFGDDIIGALVLRLERPGLGTGNWNGHGKKRAKGGKGVVRAWTVKMKYRGTGVGTELLEEAVKITRETLGNSAEIGFAAEHANSKMVLPETFNGCYRKNEGRAARALEKVIDIKDNTSRKKR